MADATHTLVVSSRAERRREVAADWLATQTGGQRLLLLAPSRGAGDDFLRVFARRASKRRHGGVLGAHRLTLGQLAWELASPRLAEAELSRLSSLGAQAMATLATADALAAGQLRRLQPVASMPGFSRALSATLRELRLMEISSDSLRELGAPGEDLATLLEHYLQELDRWRLADRARQLVVATETLAQRPEAWRGTPCLWLDLGVEFRLERRLLAELARVAGPVLMTVARGDRDSLAAGREILSEDVVDLDVDLDKDLAEGNRNASALERVQRRVFELGPVPQSDVDGETLDFFSAPGEGQECVEVARRIRQLADAGTPFDEMAILVREPHGYLPMVEDALRRARVPGYFSRGTSRPDPAGRAFLALLACAAEGLLASRFAEYLSLGQVPGLEPSAAPPKREVPWVEPQGEQLVLKTLQEAGEAPAEAEGEAADSEEGPSLAGTLPTPSHWERLLVDAAVVGGVERWRRRLAGLVAELERRAHEAGDEEELRRLAIERDLERLGHLRAFALPVIEELAAFPEAATWGEWLDRLEPLATMTLRRPLSVLELLAELRPLREVGPVSLAQVQQVLAERLSFLRSAPPKRRYGRVFVGTLSEAAGRCFSAVFVPGLAEGVFPRPNREDPLLLDDLRETLSVGLSDQGRRLLRERLLLHLAAGAARERLVVSYPRIDVERGRARVPSIYALEVLRAAEGRVPELKVLGQRAAAASGSRIGWPAPDEPELAIDDAEYDLALLQRLLRRAPGESRGEGRFLLYVNEHLKRSLHARARRWRRPWTYADGLVVGSDFESASLATRRLLEKQSPLRRSFSPTALQHFAVCPYRFFLQAVMRLRPREDPAGFEQLDPLTRGGIFHAMQFELQGELKREGLQPVVAENLDAALQCADLVIDRCRSRFEEDLAPAIPRVWRSEIESLRNDVRGWLRQLTQLPGSWRPLHFELGFGLPLVGDRDPESREEPVKVLEGARMRGAIDLVEIDAEQRIRVTDHKTGRPRRERNLVMAGGQVLQPLIYALVAEKLLGDERRQVVSGRLYYCTQRGEFSQIEVPLNPEGRQAIELVLERVMESLKKGFLPAAPAEGACRWCDYRLVCGPYEELRLRRKDPRKLQSLERLRRHR